MIREIRISNIKGIEAIEFRPKALTIIKGANGTGKSSVLDALRAAFEGGYDPAMLRQGAKKGEAIIDIADGRTIKRTITAKTSTLEITTADGAVVKKPQAYIETLASGFSFDPLAFIAADKKKRSQFLLEAMPIAFTPEEIKQAAGAATDEPVDLDGLAAIRKVAYEQRTAANVAARDSEGTIKELRRALPEDDGKDWKAEEIALRARHAELSKQRDGLVRAVYTRERVQIDAIKGELAAEIEKLKAHADWQIGQLSASMEKERVSAEQQHTAELQDIEAGIAVTRERAGQSERVMGARKTIEAMEKKGRANAGLADRLTAAIEKLDALRQQKIDSLPIEGIEIRDGEILVDGIPFDQVNTARKYMLSFQIAALKTGELPLMICDGAEALDADNWQAFCDAAKESGFQIIAARVDSGPLRVETAA